MKRLLELEGGRNFRDLGGYPTEGGGRVRWGRLYRSGVMSYLSETDAAHLVDLGVRVVCDLRSPQERKRETVPWLRPGIEYLNWDYDGNKVSLYGLLGGQAITPDTTRAAMLRLYQALPDHFELPYSALFARIAQGDLPLIFNCSAGKDRTGLAAALVLTSLGVPWPVVLEDFVLTDTAVDLEQVILQRRGSVGLDDRKGYISGVSPEARAPLLRADPAYLEAAFESIRANHGSVQGYLERRLGVTPDELTRIRSNLIQA